MSDAELSRAGRILERAAALAEEERRSFLEQACGGDKGLRREVESLLAAEEKAPSRLRRTALEPTDRAGREVARAPAEGSRLGPYRLVHQIGEGGMSTVYLAVRADDQYRRNVAVKVLRAGLGGEDFEGRLRTERQILAGLEHPNIARLYDGGATEDGRPYLVMEHIEGEPLDVFCDQRRLSIDRRLRLFLEVAAAVQHAHRNLVVHRDLKPSNILVTAEGRPKLLDFGIAKLLNPALSAGAEEPTGRWVRLMSPSYASPEQVRGGAITTASDVYSLGVVLYLLLAGRLPLELQGMELAEAERALDELAPAPPSEAARRDARRPAVARARSCSPEQLRRRLADDLDQIVLKALRKEPGRRYASVDRLAEDLERHLAGLPVRARRGSVAYRAGKLLRRHRLGLSLGLLVVAMLAGFSLSLARQNAKLAEERELSRQTRAFLEQLFESADPAARNGEPLTAEHLLERGRRQLDRPGRPPELEAALLSTLGRLHKKLGHYAEAEELLGRAVAIHRGEARGPELATVLEELGEVLFYQRRPAEAEELFRQALAGRREAFGARSPETFPTLVNLAAAAQMQNHLERSAALYTEALELPGAAAEVAPEERATALNNLAALHHLRGEIKRAERVQRRALELWRKSDPRADFPGRTMALQNLAALRYEQGDRTEAEELFRQAIAEQRRVLGSEHPDLALSLTNLAALLHQGGELVAAEPLYREALEIRRIVHGPEHPVPGQSLGNLGKLLSDLGRYAEAEPTLQKALEILEHAPEGEGPFLAAARRNLAELEARMAGREAP